MTQDSTPSPAPPGAAPLPAYPRRPRWDRGVWLALTGSAVLLALLLLAGLGWLINNLANPPQDTRPVWPTRTPNRAFVATRTAAGQRPPTAAPAQASSLPLSGATPTPTLAITASLPLTTGSPTPQSYALVGRLVAPQSGLARSVAAGDGYAYLLTRSGLLYTYDLTHLSPSQELQTYNQPLGAVRLKNGGGLLRLGRVLYAYGPSGIEIIDLTDPAQPALLAQLKDLQAASLLLDGQRLYAFGQAIIIVYDISQPLHPAWIQKLHMPAEANNFAAAIYQDRLYVSEYWANDVKTRSLLQVYSLSPGGEIREVQRIDAGELAYQMYVHTDKLIRCTSTDVEVWDLAQKDYPRYQESLPGPARVCALDQDNILANGVAFALQAGRLAPLPTFDPRAGLAGPPRFFEAAPYGSAVANGYVYLALPDQALILARQP